jgi:hypothetical protein
MSISRFFVSALFTALLSGASVSAQPLLEDSFAYADGPLPEVSSGAWRGLRGESRIVVRSASLVIPADAREEAAVARFFPAPAAGSGVEVSFTLRVDTLPSTQPGDLFPLQLTTADAQKRRARLVIRVLPDGTCQVGITARSSGAVSWAQAELTRFEQHAVRILYEGGTGRASLWINAPSPDAPPTAVALDPDTVVPRRVLLAQAGSPGPELRIGALVVREVRSGEGTAAVGAGAPVMSATAPEVEPALAPPERGFRVFLLMGQSNMAGRGVVEAVDRATDSRILVWRPDGSWGLAREPLHRDKPAVAGVGPGYAFARALLPTLPEGEVVGLIPAAFGGSKILWWQKHYNGPQRWPDGKTFFTRAVEAARSVPPGTLAGVLWIQGESDATAAQADSGAAYRLQLHALVRDLRAELRRPDLPFVAATLKPWSVAEAVAINDVYLALPDEVARTAVVKTISPELMSRLRNKPDDLPHYDAASARLIGENFAREMRSLLAAPNALAAMAGD